MDNEHPCRDVGVSVAGAVTTRPTLC